MCVGGGRGRGTEVCSDGAKNAKGGKLAEGEGSQLVALSACLQVGSPAMLCYLCFGRKVKLLLALSLTCILVDCNLPVDTHPFHDASCIHVPHSNVMSKVSFTCMAFVFMFMFLLPPAGLLLFPGHVYVC